MFIFVSHGETYLQEPPFPMDLRLTVRFICWQGLPYKQCTVFMGINRTAGGSPAPRASHPRVVLTRPCSLPATLQTLGLRRQGRIIVLPARRRPQAATPALRPGKIAPLTPMRESLLAHLPPGSAQTECIRLPYDAPPLSCGRICQGAKGPPGKQAGGERESRLSMAGALTVSRQWD